MPEHLHRLPSVAFASWPISLDRCLGAVAAPLRVMVAPLISKNFSRDQAMRLKMRLAEAFPFQSEKRLAERGALAERQIYLTWINSCHYQTSSAEYHDSPF